MEVFGFGSFFDIERSSAANDIDLLLVHAENSSESISAVLAYKRKLISIDPSLHVTILSADEERAAAFKSRCGAVFLGFLQEAYEDDLAVVIVEELVRSIRSSVL